MDPTVKPGELDFVKQIMDNVKKVRNNLNAICQTTMNEIDGIISTLDALIVETLNQSTTSEKDNDDDDNAQEENSSGKNENNSASEESNRNRGPNFVLSTNEELAKIVPGALVSITGRVRKPKKDETRHKVSREKIDLFEFIIDNETGTTVYGIAWRNMALRFEKDIRDGEIINISNAVSVESNPYNTGNSKYRIILNEGSTIKQVK